MSYPWQIDSGDTVDVHFVEGNSIFAAKVHHSPSATGDSWIIEEADGTIRYVQMFEQIVRRPTAQGEQS